MITVDTSGVEDKLRRLSQVTKTSLGEDLKQEGRLLAITLSRFTQPSGFSLKSKRQGENAISRDYLKIYPGVENIIQKVRRASRPGEADKNSLAILRYMEQDEDKAVNMLTNMKLKSSVDADPRFHNARWHNGKIERGFSQIVANQKTVQDLISKASLMVGFVKSGWITCAKIIGGNVNVNNWVSNHNAPGSVKDLTNQEDNPSISITNMVDYTSEVLKESDIKFSLKLRKKALIKRINDSIRLKLRQ